MIETCFQAKVQLFRVSCNVTVGIYVFCLRKRKIKVTSRKSENTRKVFDAQFGKFATLYSIK